MNNKKIHSFFISTLSMLLFSLNVACSSATKEINLYSTRHYDVDDIVHEKFTEETGIAINVISLHSPELLEKLNLEKNQSKADMIIMGDANHIMLAKEQGFLQPIPHNATLEKNIIQSRRDKENYWFAITERSRAIVYHPDRVNPEQDNLETYYDLSNPKWKNRLLIRSSASEYNQSLLSSIINSHGIEKATTWAKGIVANMARTPQGNDTDQMKAVYAGKADLSVSNDYYYYKLKNSSNPHEKEIGNKLKLFYPNQNNRGAHININVAGIVKNAKNKDNAIKLLEFMTSEKIQKLYYSKNHEHPINDKSKGYQSFQSIRWDNLDFSSPALHQKAIEIFKIAEWK